MSTGDDRVMVDSMISKTAGFQLLIHQSMEIGIKMNAIHGEMSVIKDQHFFPNIEKLQQAALVASNTQKANAMAAEVIELELKFNAKHTQEVWHWASVCRAVKKLW